MFKMGEVCYEDEGYLVSYSNNRGSQPWIVTADSGFGEIHGDLKKKVKKAFIEKYGDPRMNLTTTECSLDCCQKASVPTFAAGDVINCKIGCSGGATSCAQEKVKPMRDYRNETVLAVSNVPAETELSKTRDYLFSRLNEVYYVKDGELRDEFNMNSPEEPKTATEAIERIKAGKFTAPDPIEDAAAAKMAPWEYRWYRIIDWRTTPANVAGYKAAEKALDVTRDNARDTIQAMSEADGLKALNDFKTWTYAN